MDEKVKSLFSEARNAKEIVKIAEEYGYDTEIMEKNKLSESDFHEICGGVNVEKETYANSCVVVRDKNTGEILCVIPY